MEPTFPPSMLMFSHLPPVSSFARMAAAVGMPGAGQCQGPGPHLPRDMVLKKEPGSPPPPHHPHPFLQPPCRHQAGNAAESDHYRGRAQGLPGLLQGGHSSNGSRSLMHDLGREFLSRSEKTSGPDLKQSTSVKKARKSNPESQEARAKRKRSDYSKTLVGDAEAASLSPGQKPHLCEHCNATFRSSYHLRRHVLIHTGERPFQCSQCSMSFIQKYLLQRHEKIHSGEKPFSCDQCNMKFIQKYHMERHKRTHSGEKPYKCDTCQQYFSRTDRLLKHKRTCGEAIGKVGAVMDPGSSNPNSMDHLSGSLELPHGITSSSGRRKSKSKNAAMESKEHKSGNTMSETAIAPSLILPNYSVEIPIVSSSSGLLGSGTEELNARVPKLLFKKVNRKNIEKTELNMASVPGVSGQKVSAKPSSSLEMASASVEAIGLLQSTDGKQGHTSSNYDDAMQFLKKRRYLQAASSNSAYGVNVGHMVSQQSVIQSAVASVMDGESPLALIDSSPLNTEIKSCHDKSGIPDEVLQSLLDHYAHKAEGQHEVHFSLNEHHVDLHGSGENSELVQEENVCSDSQSPPNDKVNMLHEYSKYLQQALERTSHSASFPLGPSLQFVSLSSTLSNHTLFPEKQIYTTTPLECGFSQSVTSVLPATLPKSHFGMLVGPQPSFSLSPLEAGHQQLTPSQELADQLDAQKNLEPSSNYQIASQELTSHKEQQKNLETASSFQLAAQELGSRLDHQKDMGLRATYQIENFAQAFGSQFKASSRVPMAFNTNSNGDAEHRIRTSVSEFSGYANMSDMSEPGSTRVKTSTSQSYR
ncbi:LOW QUALITY PROTEIN: zinc finger protein 281 [Rhinatrema bivittatum]|uniref:LOW QUALITY PROTEIN: zinc finger protein 281 n=1 Tax=Rhinatrema bivittatum TaxID=194408 RepID=UPI00112A1564|nr:LOW QUALITY PROTEIN: zinc finger protein 281 [Rhinatrema bivittatum]